VLLSSSEAELCLAKLAHLRTRFSLLVFYYNNLFRLNGKYHRARAGMPVLPSSFERRLAESPISCVSAGRNQVRFLSPQFTSMSWQPVSLGTTTCPSPGLFMSISRNLTERGCARHSDSQQKRLECTAALCASTIKKKCSNSLNFFQNYTHETLVEIAKRKEEMGFLRRPRLEFGTQY